MICVYENNSVINNENGNWTCLSAKFLHVYHTCVRFVFCCSYTYVLKCKVFKKNGQVIDFLNKVKKIRFLIFFGYVYKFSSSGSCFLKIRDVSWEDAFFLFLRLWVSYVIKMLFKKCDINRVILVFFNVTLWMIGNLKKF